MSRLLQQPWFTEFVNCTLPHTEAPKAYLLWSAFSVLGGVLKNNVYIKDGLYTVYPNQFIVLTGPPSIGKGTAMSFAWRMVKSKTSYQLANTVSDRATAESIIESIAGGWAMPPKIVGGQALTMMKEYTCTLFAPELQTLVGASDWMLTFLCQAWDQSTYSYETKNKGKQHIKDMCVSMIGATVPDYVRGMEKNVDASVAGGFTSRCIFVFADKKSKELPFAEPLEDNKRDLDTYNHLLNDLDHISKLSGEYKLDLDAQLAFRNFYPETSAAPDDSDAMLNFKGRMKAHVYKVALILSAAKHDSPVVRGQEMKDAIWIIKQIKLQIERVFRGIGSSQLAEPTARVQLCIEKYGAVTKTELLRVNNRHMTPETLDRVIMILTAIGYCRAQSHQGKVYYSIVTKTTIPTKGIVQP